MGAGVIIDAPEAAGPAIHQILEQPGFSSAATFVAEQIADMPSPETVVDHLCDLVLAPR